MNFTNVSATTQDSPILRLKKGESLNAGLRRLSARGWRTSSGSEIRARHVLHQDGVLTLRKGSPL